VDLLGCWQPSGTAKIAAASIVRAKKETDIEWLLGDSDR
jgi:hypothetical protein